MELNFANVIEESNNNTQNTENKKTKIKGFTIDEVTITGVVVVKNDNGKEHIEIGFVNSSGAEHTEKLYMTEKSMKYDLLKLYSIAKCVLGADKVSKTMNIDQYNALLSGRIVRIKFSAEEYLGTDGNTYTKATIGLYDFVESISTSKSDTGLTLDINNKYDYKRLTNTAAQATVEEKVSGLPF